MPSSSNHLEKIVTNYNRFANLQVVFVDIEKYSKRSTPAQTKVIDSFTQTLRQTLFAVAKREVGYSQNNGVNFQSDIITLPTGDGAAIIFSFEGLPDIHLFFATEFLKEIYESNSKTPCAEFDKEGWCNCHTNFGLRIGISEGRGVVYTDINGNYNVAGGVINLASRVMGLGDSGQILFTEDAYRQIVDTSEDASLWKRFVEFEGVRIKHGLKLKVYQYKGQGEPYINANVPEKISSMGSAPELAEQLAAAKAQLAEWAAKLKMFDDLDLTRYFDQIIMVPPTEWYEYIDKARDHISLMSPSLHTWFRDPDRMRNILLAQAVRGTKIRFLIMGPENDSATEIASLPRKTGDVGFYRKDRLEENEKLISNQLRQVNEEIKKRSDSENYVELRKVLHTPIFVKTEFFGGVLHWSFFGYRIDGQLAPSFWCEERKDGDKRDRGIYQVLIEEFETIWEHDTLSEMIDVLPVEQESGQKIGRN